MASWQFKGSETHVGWFLATVHYERYDWHSECVVYVVGAYLQSTLSMHASARGFIVQELCQS